jgi:hypothetical protein
MVVVSAFLGMTSLLVSFVAASAFETRGGTSIREITAACVAAALYLAFCQFWVARRGDGGFLAKLPTLLASVAPLLLVLICEVNWAQRSAWLACGCMGSVLGAIIAQRATTTATRLPTAESTSRGKAIRNYVLGGFVLLLVVALVIAVGVVPAVVADPTPGFNAGSVGVFLGVTVVMGLLAAVLLGAALWCSRGREQFSRATLGISAFLALFLALIYAFASGIGGHGPALRTASILLVLCAVLALTSTALMTVTSVMVDRACQCGPATAQPDTTV